MQSLESLLPPKKPDFTPRPTIVDEVGYEIADVADVRSRRIIVLNPTEAFPQFGGNDQDSEQWTDDDEDGRDQAPECRTQ